MSYVNLIVQSKFVANQIPCCTDKMDSETNNQSIVPKKEPNDFIFGRVLGEGSFSTVSTFRPSFLSINFA